MARRGENIRKRKDGRWEGRYCMYEPQSGKKVIRSVYAKTYAEAKEKLLSAKTSTDLIWSRKSLDMNLKIGRAHV